MNCYEHTLITKQDLSETQTKKLIDKHHNIINKNQGKILKTEEWGLRNLSYEIKKNKKGFYFHFKLEGVGATIEELEKTENIDDLVLRFLTIRVKKKWFNNKLFWKKRRSKNIKEKWKEIEKDH